jgi:hypothetical protein
LLNRHAKVRRLPNTGAGESADLSVQAMAGTVLIER